MKEVTARLKDYKNMKERLDFQMRRNDEGEADEADPHLLPWNGKGKFKRNERENPLNDVKEDENQYR
jgi:hypothetical protein